MPDETIVIDANDLAGTADVARRLAAMLAPGVCLTLEGDLGAGKTTLVRLIVGALGGEERDVSSPTYVLLHTYATPRLTVFHLDAYRVGGADDLEAIGFAELLEQGGATIVEWASRVSEALPTRGRVDVQIETTGPTSRRFQVVHHGGTEARREVRSQNAEG
jgi:tRNA threonylcarbamoyladenosine biosynthesis protein TsaE